MFDSLGDRMKNNYENRYRIYLTRRMPVILRLDGKAFHTVTKSCERPFDQHFTAAMDVTAAELIESIQGAKLAYVQSDEISILLTDFDRLTTEAWFDSNLQKMVSVASGMASAHFSHYFKKIGCFDCRAFNIPKEEVCNYFIWRQNDWVRNSVQMLAQAHYSHKELHGKGQSEMHEMLHQKHVNWADLPIRFKNGCTYAKTEDGWSCRENIIFTRERDIVNNLLIPIEE